MARLTTSPTPGSSLPEARWWPYLLALVLAAVIAHETWPVLAGGGEVFYSVGGDSWKNIYTFVYHVMHDAEALHTDALNWPWGDHVAMSDPQPLLSNALRPLYRWGLVGERGLTYMVLVLPIISFVITGLALYALLRALGLSRAWSALWALPATLLEPQLYRLNGHYALAYAWVLPLLIWLWLRARRRGYAPVPMLVTGVTLAAIGLVHFYYLGIGGALLLALIGADWIAQRRTDWGRLAVAVALGVVLPVAVGVGFTRTNDVHDDRIAEPYGLREYVSRPEALLTDVRQPHWAWFDDHVINMASITGEGWAYLGLPVATIAVVGLFALLIRLVRRRPVHWPRRVWGLDGGALTAMVVAGLALAVFSWGLPLGYGGDAFDWVRAHAGPLRQLRSLGRFAWGTYYLLVPVGVVALVRTLAGRGRGRLAVLWLAWAVAVGEGAVVMRWLHPGATPHVLLARANGMRGAVPVPDSFAAVIPIPYFSVGSEDFVRGEVGSGLYTGTYPSLALGLPNVGLYMSRTSFRQAVQTVGLANSWWNPPDILRSAGGDRTYLLAVDRVAIERGDWVNDAYADVIAAADTLLYADKAVMLYRLRENALPAAARARRRRYLDERWPGLRLDTLTGVIQAGEPAGRGFVRETFDDRGNTEGLFGSGGVPLTGEEPQVLADLPLPRGVVGGDQLAIAFEFKLEDEGQIYSKVTPRFLAADGRELYRGDVYLQVKWHEIDRDWLLVDFVLPVPEGATRVAFTAANSHKARTPGGVIDELTLRAAGTSYAYPLGGGAYSVNGRIFRPL